MSNNKQHRIKERYIKGRQNQAMQLNRIVIVAAAVTMPSARKYGKGRRYLGKRMALLACKLDGRGTVVDEVVDHRGISSGRRDYRTIKRGGETINTQQ